MLTSVELFSPPSGLRLSPARSPAALCSRPQEPCLQNYWCGPGHMSSSSDLDPVRGPCFRYCKAMSPRNNPLKSETAFLYYSCSATSSSFHSVAAENLEIVM
ncbi:hypothetical protein NDU88_002517 [Pleurodeles waltl]|uniref:Uncharacterized protein n=1 Tax=Pleurodeles waltl TaxID=8319 RepID=A0AAV7SDA6_PLEWA|nr:hypothetical protein NDU88_002517 [Pleurodeles waltl]